MNPTIYLPAMDNSRAAWLFQPWYSKQFGRKKTEFKPVVDLDRDDGFYQIIAAKDVQHE